MTRPTGHRSAVRLRLVAGGLVVVALAGCSRARPAAAPTTTPTSTVTGTSTGTTGRTTGSSPVGLGPTPSPLVPTGSVTPAATGTPLRISEDQAAAVLVAPGDLPAGYQVDPTVGPDSRVGLPPGCPVLDAVGAALARAPVRAARGFSGGPVVPLLEQWVAVLPGTAPDLLGRFTRAGTACRTFRSPDADGVTVRFSVSPLPIDGPSATGVGEEEVVALAMGGRPSQSGLVVTQAAALRRGDVLVLFVHSGLDHLDPAVLQAAVNRAGQTLSRF